MLYLTIDDIKFSQSDYTSLEESSVTLRIHDQESGQIAYSYSEEVTAYGEMYKYIWENLLMTDGKLVNNKGKKLVAKIYDDCCKVTSDATGKESDYLVFVGKISSTGIKFCEFDCSITFNIEEDEFAANANCLKNKFIFDNSIIYPNGQRFHELRHPFTWHCVEMRPALIHWIFLIFGLLFNAIVPAFIALIALIAVIKEIIDAIIALFSGEAPTLDFDVLDWFFKLVKDVNGYMSGCQYGHPTPFIRDYLTNVCKVCGLQFESSIFNNSNSPYYNAMLLSAPVDKGTKEYVSWIDDNKPIETGDSFLQLLSRIFNISYRINNNILTVERKDFFKPNTIWLDLSNPKNDPRIISICYKFPSTSDPAGGEFVFAMDGIDWVGNEAKSLYNDIMDWNLPFGNYPHLKGIKRYDIPISPARFKGDGITTDIISTWVDIWNMVFPGLGYVLTGGSKFNNCLLLPVELTTEYKVLIWDGDSPLDEARVRRQSYSEGLYYNKDMWVAAEVDSILTKNNIVTKKPFVAGNLYDRFWYIEDPRLKNSHGLEYTAELVRDCDMLLSIDFYKSVLLPNNMVGSIEEIVLEKYKLTIKGKV